MLHKPFSPAFSQSSPHSWLPQFIIHVSLQVHPYLHILNSQSAERPSILIDPEIMQAHPLQSCRIPLTDIFGLNHCHHWFHPIVACRKYLPTCSSRKVLSNPCSPSTELYLQRGSLASGSPRSQLVLIYPAILWSSHWEFLGSTPNTAPD